MIIYFTGTGNSMSIAKDLANQLGQKALHMNEALTADVSKEKIIGLVYPCYYADMPNAVKDFVRRFEFNKSAYIFGILTHGGDPGNSLYTFKELLEEKDLSLSFGEDILMPVNSRIMYGRVTTDIKERVRKQKTKVKAIAKDIENKTINSESIRKNLFFAVVSNLSNTRFVKRLMKKNVDHDRCTTCEICVKVCPLKNIEIKKNIVIIGENCTDCLACMHWCPQQAIGFGKRKVKKEQQYHHPEVTLKDLMVKNE